MERITLIHTNWPAHTVARELSRDVFEDAMVEAKAKARSFRIKATYAYEILRD